MRTPKHLLAVACAAALTVGAVALPGPAQAVPSARIHYGFPTSEVAFVETKVGELGYGSVWAEWYAVTHDFENIRTAMQRAYIDGVTPMIMWYYWGGHMTRTCLDNASNPSLAGCGGRTRNDWMAKGDRLAQIVSEEIGTDPNHSAVIVVEPEFHNNSTGTYENLDGWLETQAGKFHNYPRQKVVAGFGEWASTGPTGTYATFNRFGNASDYIGTQILFSCVQKTDTEYQAAATRIVTQAGNEQAVWNSKPVFVYDIGLASYSGQSDEPALYPNFRSQYPLDRRRQCKVAGDYAVQQEQAVQKIFDAAGAMRQNGVIAIVFRALNDQINRESTEDWHGLAERWFGFRRTTRNPPEKRAFDNVVEGIKAENAGSPQPPPPPPPPPPPGTEWQREAESFDSHPIGMVSGDADASGHAYWNQHSNGAITTAMTATSAGAKQVRIIARGDPAAATWPNMKVYVGTTLVLDTFVDSTVWDTYVATTPSIAAGSHTLKIEFTNDATVGGEDRNLKLDVASLAPVPAPPPPPPPPSGAEWQQEAEAFPTWTTGAQAPDTNASGNAYWNIWSNGHIQTATMNATSAGPKEVRITARGDVAGGSWPLMRVSVDGAFVSEQTVSAPSYRVYRTPVSMTAGAHTLRIEFTNDGTSGTEDRNLKVDVAALFAAPFEWYQEAEAFPTWTAGASTASGSASAGAFWNLWSNGHIETSTTAASAGNKQLRVVARGAPAGGVWPVMRLVVDGAPVSEQTVGSATWATYTAAVNLTAGAHTFQIHYLNDGAVGAEDRNLHLDAAGLVAGAPVWSLEGEAFAAKPVGASTPDGTASGGFFWNLWGNGALTTTATVPRTAGYRVEVVAKGDSANGIWPNMRVWVDNEVIRDFTVTTNSWRTYGLVVDLAAGAHTLKVEFTNDVLTPTEDRNLKVDLGMVIA